LSKSEKMVEVFRAGSEMEALVIQSLLESYGIPSLLQANAAPSVHVFTIDGMGEARVMVRESMAAKARKLIEGKDDV